MIVIFGTKNCKHCKEQRTYLANTFGKDGWIYIDVFKSNEAMKVASSIDIDKIPAIVVFQENEEVFRTEGTCSPDRLFSILHPNALPFKKESKDEIFSGKKSKTFVSCEPTCKVGTKVKAMTYNGGNICDLIIEDIVKYDMKAISDFERDRLLKNGGRKDFAWLIKFKKE